MKMRYLFFLGLIICSGCNSSSYSYAERGVKIYDPEGAKLIDSTATPEVIAKGYRWTEGPLYLADEDCLLFSDIPTNRVCKWTRNGDTSTYLSPSGSTAAEFTSNADIPGSNGLMLTPDKKLVLLQHGDRRVALMDAPLGSPAPRFLSLVDQYKGKRLNSPNDGLYDTSGNLYFTDPAYGLKKGLEDPAKELPFQGVFCLRKDGELFLFTDEVRYPNGIALAPDSKRLYVANSDHENKIWMEFELDDSGRKKSGRIFYRATDDEGKHNGNPDGMKFNKQGYLFATGPEGVWIFNPAGKLLARIFTGGLLSNCALGKEEKELFITCGSELMRIPLK